MSARGPLCSLALLGLLGAPAAARGESFTLVKSVAPIQTDCSAPIPVNHWPSDEPLGVVAYSQKCPSGSSCSPIEIPAPAQIIIKDVTGQQIPGAFATTDIMCGELPRYVFEPVAGHYLPPGSYYFYSGGTGGWGGVVVEQVCETAADCPPCQVCSSRNVCADSELENHHCGSDAECWDGLRCVDSWDGCRSICAEGPCETDADCPTCLTCPDGICTGTPVVCEADAECGVVMICRQHDDPCLNQCVPPTNAQTEETAPADEPELGPVPAPDTAGTSADPDAKPDAPSSGCRSGHAAQSLALVLLALAAWLGAGRARRVALRPRAWR